MSTQLTKENAHTVHPGCTLMWGVVSYIALGDGEFLLVRPAIAYARYDISAFIGPHYLFFDWDITYPEEVD